MSVVLLKTQALCLNVRPFAKTSQMVTWLTQEGERVTTPVKGAQRVKSGFLGRYDLGYTCELVYYARERNGVHHIRECSPLEFREELHTSWRRAGAASYACDLALRTASPALPNAKLYTLLRSVLDALGKGAPHTLSLILLWFESNLLSCLGVAPDFRLCTACPPAPAYLFSVEEGHFICPHRPSHLRQPPTLSLHANIPALYAHFVSTPLEAVLEETRLSKRVDDLGRPEPFPGVFGLRRFLGVFLNGHLDLLPGARRTVLDLLLG